jgi:hypothetical protein
MITKPVTTTDNEKECAVFNGYSQAKTACDVLNQFTDGAWEPWEYLYGMSRVWLALSKTEQTYLVIKKD